MPEPKKFSLLIERSDGHQHVLMVKAEDSDQVMRMVREAHDTGAPLEFSPKPPGEAGLIFFGPGMIVTVKPWEARDKFRGGG